MKNASIWKPSKFKVKENSLYPIINKENPSYESWLGMQRVCEAYNQHSLNYFKGELLDLGCGELPFYALYAQRVSSVTAVDWSHAQARVNYLDYEMDLNKPLDLESNTYNTILLSDVLEHIRRPEALIQEMHRILKADGHVILNIPFMYKVHDAPYDYYRYTQFCLQSMFEDNNFQQVVLIPTGGIFDVIADLLAKTISFLPWIGKYIALYFQKIIWCLLYIYPLKQINQKTKPYFTFGYFGIYKKVNHSNWVSY